MKKFTLFFVAMLFSALSFAELNPYAYGLKSSREGTTLTVNYSLNAPATGVSVVIMDGAEEVKTVTCDGITKGSHSVDISTLDLPTGKSLTWKVVVTGNSVASPTLHDESIRFYLPYGMDIDVDPESDYLGHWYVIEATNGGQSKTGYQSNPFGRGLYAFDAALNPILNSAGTRGFLGGVNAGATETNINGDYVNFYRVATSGGRVFIGRYRDGASYHPIVEANPANLNTNFTTVFTTGRAVSIDAIGSGENLKLVMLAKDNNIYEYDLGNAKSIDAASRTINKGTLSIARDDATITYDNNGDIWFNQHQESPTAEAPTIAHLSIENGFDWNNVSASISHANTSNSGIAVSPDGKQLAVVGAGQKNITIYNINNAGGNITLTKAYTIATAGNNHTALAWDYAGNLFAANRTNERIRIFAMPYSGTVSTPCASKHAFELEEVETYTITAHAADNTMGYVTGGGTYYAGETVTLKAVANSTYCFVNWSDGNTDATRTFTATADVTLTANFAKASPRAWAYDLKMVEDGDNYKFSFNATTAANATLLFLDKEGNELYAAHEVGAVAAGANTISIKKAYFTQVKDVYWSVKMDGEAITSVAEITDQTRGIYDFYNMQGVVVDNDPNSEKFGEIYIEMAKSGTTNSKAQTLGLFLLNQNLDVLNDNPNKGIIPTMPSGYALDGTNYTFQRLNIDPTTGKLVFSYGISSKPAVFAIDRENMTGDVTNLLDGISGLTKTVAHCFDAEGTLYVMDIASSKGTIYKIKDGIKTVFAATTGRFVSSNITMAADGRGGLWVAQYRGQMDSYYQLVHFNDAGTADFSVYDDKGTYNATNGTVGVSSTGFTGHSYRGALAYDVERQILAQGRNSTVEVFQVAYDATTGVPTLIKIATTPQVNKANIDGLAFDYAGDLYVVNSGTEKFYKYTLPTAENICTVPAPESQAIIKEVRYTVTVNTVGNGTATGAGEYVVGETAILKATPAANHKFVNWTYDSETSNDNPLSLVVNGDITVTANFAPVQYTLIAPTNDEDKGTVTGAGTYNYGTEVTLTANPAAGYKLLYWSDRSTDNPRTITMTKNEALSAYFVKEYVVEPTFTIEKVWENTNVPAATADGYQAVGWDGKIYMQNKTAGQIQVFSNGTDAPTNYAVSNTNGQQIAIDEAGNMIVFNAYFATATPTAIQIYKKGSTTAKAVTFTLKDPARCDFFSASGDIYSAEGGYVYFYCAGKTVINRLKITNGAATAADVTTDVVGEAVYSSPQNTNYVMVDIFGNLVAHARSNAINAINVYTNESKAFTLPSIKMGTLGGCSFELGGKELWAYHAGASNYSSEWNIYNMTDSKFLSNDDFYAVDKEATTNNACNWLNVQVVDENTAYIYQFCPKKAVAVWKVTMHEVVLRDTENNEVLLIDLNGSTTNVSVYRSLTGGMYNTLCLPFDVNDLTGTPLENATIWQYNRAVKGDGTNKEIFLEFDEVESITAGEPYLVEPAEDIAAPMEFKNVTISVTNGNDVAQDAVTMYGILHPTELQANDKSILFLVENNNLAWANETANMNGMRAYFKVNEPSLLSARTRAYIRREPTVATDMENITTSETEIKKVIYNGTLYIIRGDEVYTIQGTKVK